MQSLQAEKISSDFEISVNLFITGNNLEINNNYNGIIFNL